MIALQTFLSNVQKNAARVRSYESGHDGSDGTCDCIGLVIGAVRLSGVSWPWTFGSNYTARNKVDNIRPVSGTSDLRLGSLVFKAREPGHEKWNLPNAYRDHPDQRDYYHVGVVTRLKPLEITHCTSTGTVSGIFRDTTLGQWAFAGELSLVDYDAADAQDAEADNSFSAIVTAPSGHSVNLRASASTGSRVLYPVPIGMAVTVHELVNDVWARITYDAPAGKSYTGCMMRQFLKLPASGTEDTVPVPKAWIQEVIKKLEQYLGVG